MELNITLAEALERASEGLRTKMLHSVELLQKAEKIALNYDAENGYFCRFGMGHKSTMGDKRMPYNPQNLRPCHKVRHNALNKFGGVVGKRPSQ